MSPISFVSFQDEESFPLPSGSTITFRFGEPTEDGRLPFYIDPSGVHIGDIATKDGGRLAYTLASVTSGFLEVGKTEVNLEFSAVVRATLTTGGRAASRDYAVRFTTGGITARDATATATVSATGQPLDLSSRSVILVGGATSRTDAYPGPGKAVYAYLAGSFDRFPPELSQ